VNSREGEAPAEPRGPQIIGSAGASPSHLFNQSRLHTLSRNADISHRFARLLMPVADRGLRFFSEPGLTIVYECCCNASRETSIHSKGYSHAS